MKLADIINQLRAILPKYTDVFSNVVGISSISASGGVATIDTTAVHGLLTGVGVTISDVQTHTAISAVSKDGNVYTFTTSADHDLTYGWHTEVTLSGFTDAAWNDTLTLVGVPNRRTFKVRSSNSLPSLNTNEILLEVRSDGVNGRWQITVVDSDTFTITGDILNGTYSGGSISSNPRISGAVTVERAIEEYTEQGLTDYWLFVVMSDAAVSKDRTTYSDATATRTTGNDMRLRLVDGFSLYILVNTTEDIAAIDAVDVCRHDLFLPVLKSVNGVRFDTGLTGSSDFKTILLGHNAFDYNRAVLIYEFEFQSVMDLTDSDTVEDLDSRAFRDIDYTHEIGSDDTEDMTAEIDLDEEPV